MSTPQFCNALAIVLGRPVTARTGLNGNFDFHLEFDPDSVNPGYGDSGWSADWDRSDSSQPSIFSALQQQSGLSF
jgi:uncharacterized protein (TIGR03435 family)